MEIRARYLLIGLFVLAVAAGGVGFIYWLSNGGGLGERTAYRVRFDGSVSGLLQGSDVLFNGVTVGEVTELQLVADMPGSVMATIAVDSRTPVRADTRVGLDFRGLTGSAAVALSGGAPNGAALPAVGGAPPLLVADTAAIKDMTQSARDALARLDTILAENAGALKDAIANIDTFSAALARNSDRVDGILKGLEGMVGGKSETVWTYHDLTPPETFPPIAGLPTAQLAIPTPGAMIALDTQRILLQTAAGEAPAFEGERWTDNVPLLFQARIVQGFQNAKFTLVGTDAGGFTGDYTLPIDLHRFRIATSPGPAVAEIEFAAKLIGDGGRVVDTRTFSASVPVAAADDVKAAAAGLDAAFGKVATELIVWTIEAMNQAGRASPPPASSTGP